VAQIAGDDAPLEFNIPMDDSNDEDDGKFNTDDVNAMD